MNHHKIVLIRPFFQGNFLNYFQLFLNSCACNPNFEWLIFTDNKEEYEFPHNVHKVIMTFEEAKALFQSKFDFPINISKPYKLCDYKASFGYVFSDYIKEYDFWGHTDYDIIYGKLDNFVTDDMLEIYDKLFTQGHFSLYKNTHEINTMFMTEINGELLYRKVMSSSGNCNFDEDWNGITNVNDIFRQKKLNLYENYNNCSMIADIYAKSSSFKVVYQNRPEYRNIIERRKKSIFVHEAGRLNRYFYDNNEFTCKEYMYIHLKQRNMELLNGVEQCTDFVIIPDAFYPLKDKVDTNSFASFQKKTLNMNYLKLRYNNLKTKIRTCLH